MSRTAAKKVMSGHALASPLEERGVGRAGRSCDGAVEIRVELGGQGAVERQLVVPRRVGQVDEPHLHQTISTEGRTTLLSTSAGQ